MQSTWTESHAWAASPVLTCQRSCPFTSSPLGADSAAWVPKLSFNSLPALLLGLGLSSEGGAGNAGLASCDASLAGGSSAQGWGSGEERG